MSDVAPPPWATLFRAPNPGPMTLQGTNTWVLAAPGSTGRVVVDPGPLGDSHLEAVAAAGPVDLVLLTHRHPDHAAGAHRFREMVQAPMAAVDPAYTVDAEPLTAGTLVAGGLSIEVTPTPGHTSDSVSFLVTATAAGSPVDAAVLTGDTVLGSGTTVVAHPDGVLADYLRSLETLAALTDDVCLLPGHGPVRRDAADVVASYVAHRRQRLAEVRAAVAAGAETAEDVVALVYADVDPGVHDAAVLSVRAQLAYLEAAR